MITAPTNDRILDGITRKSVIQIAKDLDIDPIELEISRLQLFSQSPLDAQTAKFSLSDELANGSGFSSWIYETGFNNAINTFADYEGKTDFDKDDNLS